MVFASKLEQQSENNFNEIILSSPGIHAPEPVGLRWCANRTIFLVFVVREQAVRRFIDTRVPTRPLNPDMTEFTSGHGI